jgi:ParB/RepB/Spo0J family partition protein
MKLHNVPLDEIVDNPWRDKRVYPIDQDHVAELAASIKDHEFFQSLKGRRRNGQIEIGCGHARVAAARKRGLETVPIFLDDLDDDGMLRLMVDENALQAGTNPGAVINEVAAVTRRLVEIIIAGENFSRIREKSLFDGAKGFDTARGKLLRRLDDPSKDGGIGEPLIRRYLGQGKEEQSHRSHSEIREAISALKQSGRYDRIVDDALHAHPLPVADKPAAKTKAVAEAKAKSSRRRILDERTAHLFPNDHQFKAFREAVTSPSAQRVLPVDQQYTLAKEILGDIADTNKKQVSGPYIKKMVQAQVEEGLKKQRQIDKEERDRYFAECVEAEIDAELNSAYKSLSSVSGAVQRLITLSNKYPGHPIVDAKIGGFSAKLDDLVASIKRLAALFKR